METPLVPGPVQGYPSFRTPPGLARSRAKAIGWDACSTASNHSLDAGQYGIGTTLRALDRAGLKHAGTARSPSEAGRSTILEVKGVKVAFLSFTAVSNGQASPTLELQLGRRPGGSCAPGAAGRRRGAQAVIVNLHWGTEFSHADLARAGSARAAAHALARRSPRSSASTCTSCSRSAGPRQAGRLRRGQPGLQPDRRLLPGRVAGRPDRADRLHRRRQAASRPRGSATCPSGCATRLQGAAGEPPARSLEADRRGGRAPSGNRTERVRVRRP